ncbi:hypothetical protein OIE68_30150 [Nocardia vinacea]|uniref:hypothetical protein n=1 Tax=Nocardia vinacea TaxID=96468 RepID=UPI002E111B02|nr:hypothetical protein OIE68_30150 [Nocardia vinacea]
MRIDKGASYIHDNRGSTMDDVCRTEFDGLRVTWRLIQNQLISIVAVHDASDASPVLSFGPAAYPDLARARELHPGLTKVWDAVRRDFWTTLIPPRRNKGSQWQWT